MAMMAMMAIKAIEVRVVVAFASPHSASPDAMDALQLSSYDEQHHSHRLTLANELRIRKIKSEKKPKQNPHKNPRNGLIGGWKLTRSGCTFRKWKDFPLSFYDI